MKSLCFSPRFHRNSARMRKTSRVFTEIPFRQGKCGTFSPRFCFDGQNVARFCQNSAWTSKTRRVFTEIPSRRAKRRTFLSKFCLDKQNAARSHRNSAWTDKTPRVFMKIPSVQAKRRAFSSKFRLDGKNATGRSALLRQGSTTRAGFRQNSVWTRKTRPAETASAPGGRATRAACLSAARPRRPWSAREACAAART